MEQHVKGDLLVTTWNWIRLAPVVLASLVTWSLTASSSAIVQDEETLEWLNDYDEALALAKETGKPIFLEFRCSP